ncbi:hypothetical protein [Staphylococcus sp. HMSC69H07]|nr:hypothetical protein [Staphylococcus sp. HMSC69H07]
MSRYVNNIIETIPDNKFEEFKYHRGATSYHPKITKKIVISIFISLEITIFSLIRDIYVSYCPFFIIFLILRQNQLLF